MRTGCLSLRAQRSNPVRGRSLSGLLHHFVVRNDDYALRFAMTIVPALST
ncbi:MAG: hypothetical protein LBT00_14715 [Spirochaetaceae bacterium]|nr:hypothetical protein [Spirochaetaceae bacterium]